VWSEENVWQLSAAKDASDVLGLLAESGSEREEVETVSGGVSHVGKYRALARWLASRTDDRVSTTFAQIEEILGFPLPPSCRKHQPHWHSCEGSAVARAIIDAGWVARDVDLGAERISFERRP
jgi:hypothetical protein